MAFQNGKNIAVTGAGNQALYPVLCTLNIAVSAGATLSLRKTSGAGVIVAQTVLAAAGNWSLNFGDGLLCDSGSWFIENSAGNLTGGCTGFLTT